MSKIKRFENAGPQFTPENPESGCFWHALSKEGREHFEKKSTDFGQTTVETTGTRLAGQRCIRCRPDRQGVSPWLARDGALLAISKSDLSTDDWMVAGKAGDIHVKATAALDHGTLINGDESQEVEQA